jgi:hypothetical protein
MQMRSDKSKDGNGLTSIRAVDRMNALADSDGTLPALVKDWTALRNRGVHPTKGGVDPSQIDHQKLVDQVHHVTALMYHIVFALIGYKGPCTNYAEHGFPERSYPPEPVATPTVTAVASPASAPGAALCAAAPAKTITPRKSSVSKKDRLSVKAPSAEEKKARAPSSKRAKAKTVVARKRKKAK